MQESYNVTEIAEYIITYFSANQKPISNLKLQNLLYFVWVEYYRMTGKYLFEEEFQAWPLGPSSPIVFHKYAAYGGMPIAKKYNVDMDWDTIAVIDAALKKYGDLSAGILVGRTHKPNTPWSLIFNNGCGNRDTIPFNIIIKNEPELLETTSGRNYLSKSGIPPLAMGI